MLKGILVLMLALSLFGCASTDSKPQTNQAMLEPQALLKFGDIPVPVGFKMANQESYAFETSGIRVGVLKYRGKASSDLVVNFYKEQMGMYNWNLLNVVEYGQKQLNFDRESETCVVNVNPHGSGSVITITVGPKSQSYKKAKAAKE
jgi:hypothetical protein